MPVLMRDALRSHESATPRSCILLGQNTVRNRRHQRGLVVIIEHQQLVLVTWGRNSTLRVPEQIYELVKQSAGRNGVAARTEVASSSATRPTSWEPARHRGVVRAARRQLVELAVGIVDASDARRADR